jgi:hypothetical protein
MVWPGRLKVKLVSIILKIEFKKVKVVNGLIRDIKGYHIHI